MTSSPGRAASRADSGADPGADSGAASRADARPADRVRSLVGGGLAILQVLAAPLTALVLGAGPATGQISDANASPITPAGYAFSIWGLIYLASLGYAVYQLLPGQIGRPVHRRTGWWMAAAFGCSTVWVPIFGTETVWLSQIVIVLLVGSLLTASRRASASGPAPTLAERALLRLPITLYLGWALLAATAGFGTTFRSLGMPAEAAWVDVVSVVLVLAATALCLVVVGRGTALASFAFTACWALVAVAVASTSAAVTAVAVLAVLIVVAALIVRTGRSPRKPVVLLG